MIQEFPLEGDDRTTTNYDRVQEALGVRANPPAGGLIHTAGFEEESGIFRIFGVWESQEAWDAFLNDRLIAIVRPRWSKVSDEIEKHPAPPSPLAHCPGGVRSAVRGGGTGQWVGNSSSEPEPPSSVLLRRTHRDRVGTLDTKGGCGGFYRCGASDGFETIVDAIEPTSGLRFWALRYDA